MGFFWLRTPLSLLSRKSLTKSLLYYHGQSLVNASIYTDKKRIAYHMLSQHYY